MTAPDTGHGPATVAVGYDGSEAAQDAVRWAAEYAAAGNYRIRVIHAWVWPMFTKKLGPVKGVEGSGLRHSAEAILAEGVDLARTSLAAARAAGTDRTSRTAGTAEKHAEPIPTSKGLWKQGFRLRCCAMRPATPASWWSAAAASGACWGTLPGSVCLALAGSSPCPLMVIRRGRGPGQAAAPVVVGIDGTSRSSAASGRRRPACHDGRGAPADCPHRQDLRQGP